MSQTGVPQSPLLKQLRRSLPESIRAPLRGIRALAFNSKIPVLVRLARAFGARLPPTYEDRLAEETSTFQEQADIHELPDIYHYWSNKFLRPELERFGYSGPNDFFRKELLALAGRTDGPIRLISIGAGNCDLELDLAVQLRNAGVHDFTMTCTDIATAMLKRGELAAARLGLLENVSFEQADANSLRPEGSYHAVIANQSLHHVVDLEHLFDVVSQAIGTEGVFLTSDIIGRNGHMRWPEAFAIVQEFWSELPRRKRFNLQLERYERKFLDWDCSKEAFEGIRAQDILPLLVERFHFEFFFAYANVIDPFIDRSFGFHFDPGKPEDRAFIDRVHARDEAELRSGNIKPTHMIAKLSRRTHVKTIHQPGMPPGGCMRPAAV